MRSFAATADFRRGFANFSWLVTDKIVRTVLGVSVGFWVVRYLGPTQFGVLSIAMATMAILHPFADLGFESLLRREFLHRPDRAPSIAASARTLRLVGSAAASLLACAWALCQPAENADRIVIIILATTLFSPVFAVSEPWLQARLEVRRAVPKQWLILVCCAAARVTAILQHGSIAVFAAIAAAESLLSAVAIAQVSRRQGLRCGSFDQDFSRKLLHESWPLLFASFAVIIYMRIDVLMLESLAGAQAAGVYAAAVRLTELFYLIPMALATSTYPALVRAQAAGTQNYQRCFQRYLDFSILAALGPVSILTLGAPWIIRSVYGEQFAPAADILSIHASGIVFASLGVARSQHLVNAGLTKFSLLATITGAVLNVALNLVLIPRYAGTGAAISAVISYGSSAWLTSFLHPATRQIGWWQTKALCLPVFGWRYLRRSP